MGGVELDVFVGIEHRLREETADQQWNAHARKGFSDCRGGCTQHCETCDTIIGPCPTSPLALQLYTDLTQFSAFSFSAELRAHDPTSNAHALAQDCAEKKARSHAICYTW